MITYTLLAALVLIAVFIFGFGVLKSEVISTGKFWIAYGIVVIFQLLTNGYLTSQKIVTYNPNAITGTRIAYAPIEDLFFGFALVTLTIFIWDWIPSSRRPKQKSRKNKNDPD